MKLNIFAFIILKVIFMWFYAFMKLKMTFHCQTSSFIFLEKITKKCCKEQKWLFCNFKEQSINNVNYHEILALKVYIAPPWRFAGIKRVIPLPTFKNKIEELERIEHPETNLYIPGLNDINVLRSRNKIFQYFQVNL